MKILVLGAAGMIGRKLVERIVKDGGVGGKPVSGMLLFDVVAPKAPADAPFPVEVQAGDLGEPGRCEGLVAGRPDLIVHLAAIVSGEAEADFEKGYRVNLDSTRNLFEAIRAIGGGYKPRVVFTSSIAVFGQPFPKDGITDEFNLTPLTSYGTQKAIGELLLADYSRRGFLDGVGIRLPTICVRPGLPNKAASGFFSGIIREPLNGKEAILPVAETTRHWHASPRAAIGFLLHAATMDTAPLGQLRSLTMPGLSVTVGEQIEALRRVAGDTVAARIRREPDPVVQGIVAGWAERCQPERAQSLGFKAETSFDEIIQVYIDDELGGRVPG
ncbi:D-erythronate dehydrogenase [Enterovirga rhinocerotis]|uniref:Nucleoside-diphosphate-sugar epimerase n=1 Tax=Enterovirga rhinocerotis TaxID=1339210 RepID=A0A4R7BUE7_9HYPH|nr:D-erythronate dehydrogenase [Enterovirga rhinocerotis]TDR88205.1 nucleoside-diphosphate-sugar epimerase [Enterovirga rhinocerotis]